MKITELNENNVQLYAMIHYDNPSCTSTDEFYEDLTRIKYITRLLRKYKQDQSTRPRLVFNHLIVLYNVFGIDVATNLLFFRLDADLHSILKTYLVFLNFFPTYDSYVFLCSDIAIDDIIMNRQLYDNLITQYGDNWDEIE